MSFEHPWMLFLLIVPLLWMILNWRRSSRRRSLAFKALCFCALVLAATKPGLVFCSSRMAVAVLANTSAKTSDQDLNTNQTSLFVVRALVLFFINWIPR